MQPDAVANGINGVREETELVILLSLLTTRRPRSSSRGLHLASPQAQTTWPALPPGFDVTRRKDLVTKPSTGPGAWPWDTEGGGRDGGPASGQRAGTGGPSRWRPLPRPPKVKSLGQLEFPKLFSPVTLAWLTPQLKASPSQGRPRETSLGFFF